MPGAKPDDETIRCPRCMSIDVRYAHRTWWDVIASSLLKTEVFRCRACRAKFRKMLLEEEE